MGLPTESLVPHISPELVGNTFLKMYYGVLHGSPESLYRFFHDSSILSRPDANGTMKSVTTTEAINDLILTLDCKNYITEILAADSQQSYKNGVFIQVTGYLIGLDKTRQRFFQSFFLAPQHCGGYFVLNDVFRFVDDNKPREGDQMLANGVSDPKISPLTTEQVQDLCATDPLTPLSEELRDNGEESHDVAQNGGSVAPREVIMETSNIDTEAMPQTPQPVVQEDLPKKSYASILAKGSESPNSVYLHTTMALTAPTKPEKLPLPSTTYAPAPEITASSNNSTSETNDSDKEGHSIFIHNLPMNATVAQVVEVFKKFGQIKPQGVQVKNHKLERKCFGFVEFESLDSKQTAIEASSVMIGNRQVFIAEKKTATRVNGGVSGGSNVSGSSGRGPYSVGRGYNSGGGFQNDNFRYSVGRGYNNGGGFQNDNFMGGQGSFGSNQAGFARNEFRSAWGGGRGYPGRGRGPLQGRTSVAYQPRTVRNVLSRMEYAQT